MSRRRVITRFAPSPTGPLHLGHAFSAMTAFDMARAHGGCFVLRIEDIDRSRSRVKWEREIERDLAWLGLSWPRPVVRQSDRAPAYREALLRLAERGLTYACICNRSDIREAAAAPQEGAPMLGPDGIVYPGTCKHADHPYEGSAIRLHMDRALALVPEIAFEETGAAGTGRIALDAEHMLRMIGDVVLARRDMGTSYHLSVVLDDSAQSISHVVRGLDLFDATPIHVLLQSLLGLRSPIYHHHRLIRDDTGKRLAKRDDARSIAAYRDTGATPADIRRLVGLPSAS
ncbi:tRNA glutamyl-Q(34) synthetase GluQRS [Palleronia abyssalis]|uniref:Glutamate--tRNA ligase n=1 Tax=Palleronia abyssalis TaxID=1501240 RepID=A0A2R8BQ83_9RHOB|nr:tRNA glutamyl-Q(34) synthetase GluQRS [Palleronia abyssalis]SPJ22285.1 Glutamate--tRNA ligase [Palleronia abyssalis]